MPPIRNLDHLFRFVQLGGGSSEHLALMDALVCEELASFSRLNLSGQ